MKSPTFDYSTDEESKDFGNESSFSEDDEDILIVKSLEYKLRARKVSEIRSLAQKTKTKRPRGCSCCSFGLNSILCGKPCKSRSFLFCLSLFLVLSSCGLWHGFPLVY
jgi:hypothetical protein